MFEAIATSISSDSRCGIGGSGKLNRGYEWVIRAIWHDAEGEDTMTRQPCRNHGPDFKAHAEGRASEPVTELGRMAQAARGQIGRKADGAVS